MGNPFCIGLLWSISFNLLSTLNLFELNLTETGPVKIAITDSQGHLIREVLNEHMIAGMHIINIEPDSLQSGLYFLIVRSSQENQLIRFNVS